MNVSKIEAKAIEMAAKAKPGYMNIGNEIFTFVFSQKEWYYEVYKNGEFFLNVNTKSLSSAKLFVKRWLEN